MKCKSVEKEYDRIVFEFEHAGVTWFKFLPRNVDELTYKNWMNSLIDDVVIREVEYKD